VKIVVDTNIVFSALLNSSSPIGKILIGSRGHLQFYSCEFLREELLKHNQKLLKLTGLTSIELEELQYLVTKNITFLHQRMIPTKIMTESEILLDKIDIADAPFVALSKHLKAKLWTGDKILLNGLKRNKYIDTYNTSELSLHLNKLKTD
jgi:predicted nucleic acid-binding protein